MFGVLLNILAFCGVLLAAPTYPNMTSSIITAVSTGYVSSLANTTWHYPVLSATPRSITTTLSSHSISSASALTTSNPITSNKTASNKIISNQTASISTVSTSVISSSTTLPYVEIQWSSVALTSTAAVSTTPALQCGAHQPVPTGLAYTNGPGFSLCIGNWTALDFCTTGKIGFKPLWHGQLRPQSEFYLLSPDYGIYVSIEVQTDRSLCNDDKPPANQKSCGEDCNSECFNALTSILNDCDTTTTSNKHGGSRTVGSKVWSIFSIPDAQKGDTYTYDDSDQIKKYIQACSDGKLQD